MVRKKNWIIFASNRRFGVPTLKCQRILSKKLGGYMALINCRVNCRVAVLSQHQKTRVVN